MLFDEALFHADPHPGNLIVMGDGRLGILDFGMIGRIDETLRETIEEMLVAISSGDQHRLMRLIRRIGDAPPTLDDSALAIDVAEFIGTYGRQRLGEFDMTGALNDLSEMLHRHAITLAQSIRLAVEDVDLASKERCENLVPALIRSISFAASCVVRWCEGSVRNVGLDRLDESISRPRTFSRLLQTK